MNIFTYSIGKKISIFQIPYISMVEEIISEVDIRNTQYYLYILKLYKDNNHNLWDYINSEQEVCERALLFREFARNIVKNGFDKDKGQIKIIDNKPYGKITVMKKKDEWILIDGHHRISVLIYMGVKDFEIVNNLYLIPKI